MSFDNPLLTDECFGCDHSNIPAWASFKNQQLLTVWWPEGDISAVSDQKKGRISSFLFDKVVQLTTNYKFIPKVSLFSYLLKF